MYNSKLFLLVGIALTIVSLNSCNQTPSSVNNSPSEELSISFSKNNIVIEGDSSNSCTLNVKIGDIIAFDNKVIGKKTFAFSELIKSKRESQYGIAYHLATNHGDLPIHLTISTELDTTILYHIDIRNIVQYKATVVKGKCARLFGDYETTNVEADIIKWLYRQQKTNVGDSIISLMRLYLKEINRTKYSEYITHEEMPVVPSLSGISYNISSDLVADNYYLFSCTNEKEIEEFVEEMVSIKFEGATHSLNNPMLCFRKASTCGTTCIMLIGINKDWSYQIVPIGLICIDDIKPSVGFFSTRKAYSDATQFVFNKKQIRVTSKVKSPSFIGAISLSYGNFQGALYYNIPFTINWTGDITKLVIHKSSSSVETIDLTSHISPLHKTINGIVLGIGDNFIPIEVYDACGNVEKYDLSIKTVRIEDNKPEVNIENNIYNR